MAVQAGSKFFGARILPGENTTVCLVDSNHDGYAGGELTLTNAALAPPSGQATKGNGVSVLEVATAVGDRFAICTLRTGATEQFRFEMIFSTADGQVTLYNTGNRAVDVAGTYSRSCFSLCSL